MTRLGSPTDHLGRDWSGSATDIGSQLTAENRSIDVGGDSLIYRRFGNNQTNEPPLLCLQHFGGNLDFWDPALVDRIAWDREVILLAAAASAHRPGSSPTTWTDMARDVILFIDTLGLEQLDLLGFSLGGHIAQFADHVRAFLNAR